MDFHETKCKLFLIYEVMGVRVAILRFLYLSIFFNARTDYFAIVFSISLNFYGFQHEKYTCIWKPSKFKLLGP